MSDVKEVQRYDFHPNCMLTVDKGQYVEFSDYQQLREENERLLNIFFAISMIVTGEEELFENEIKAVVQLVNSAFDATFIPTSSLAQSMTDAVATVTATAPKATSE